LDFISLHIDQGNLTAPLNYQIQNQHLHEVRLTRLLAHDFSVGITTPLALLRFKPDERFDIDWRAIPLRSLPVMFKKQRNSTGEQVNIACLTREQLIEVAQDVVIIFIFGI
jgi:hypothetical protein